MFLDVDCWNQIQIFIQFSFTKVQAIAKLEQMDFKILNSKEYKEQKCREICNILDLRLHIKKEFR